MAVVLPCKTDKTIGTAKRRPTVSNSKARQRPVVETLASTSWKLMKKSTLISTMEHTVQNPERSLKEVKVKT